MLPLGKLPSDANFTFFCLGMVCFKTWLIHYDRSSFFDLFDFKSYERTEDSCIGLADFFVFFSQKKFLMHLGLYAL